MPDPAPMQKALDAMKAAAKNESLACAPVLAAVAADQGVGSDGHLHADDVAHHFSDDVSDYFSHDLSD